MTTPLSPSPLSMSSHVLIIAALTITTIYPAPSLYSNPNRRRLDHVRWQQRSSMFLQEVKDNLQREKRQEEKAAEGPVGFGEAMLNFVRLRREEKNVAAATLGDTDTHDDDAAAGGAGPGPGQPSQLGGLSYFNSRPGSTDMMSRSLTEGEGGKSPSHASSSDTNLLRFAGRIGSSAGSARGLAAVVEEADEHAAAHGQVGLGPGKAKDTDEGGDNVMPFLGGGGVGSSMTSITSSLKRAVRNSFASRSPTSTNTPSILRQSPSLASAPTGGGIVLTPLGEGLEPGAPLHSPPLPVRRRESTTRRGRKTATWGNQKAEKTQPSSLIGLSHAKVFAAGPGLEQGEPEQVQGTSSHGEVGACHRSSRSH